jgi:hypothetical protein
MSVSGAQADQDLANESTRYRRAVEAIQQARR